MVAAVMVHATAHGCTSYKPAFAIEYPPGTSKWKPTEYRLFCEISKNWAGQPLESYETMLQFIRTTKTKAGLTVSATRLGGNYPTGVKTSNAQMAEVHL
jgi:hypothetical protein